MLALAAVVFVVSLILFALLFCVALELCRRMDGDRDEKHWMED